MVIIIGWVNIKVALSLTVVNVATAQQTLPAFLLVARSRKLSGSGVPGLARSVSTGTSGVLVPRAERRATASTYLSSAVRTSGFPSAIDRAAKSPPIGERLLALSDLDQLSQRFAKRLTDCAHALVGIGCRGGTSLAFFSLPIEAPSLPRPPQQLLASRGGDDGRERAFARGEFPIDLACMFDGGLLGLSACVLTSVEHSTPRRRRSARAALRCWPAALLHCQSCRPVER